MPDEKAPPALVETMTPRDWFAAAVLVGILMQDRNAKPEEYADTAFRGADLMMSFRARPK